MAERKTRDDAEQQADFQFNHDIAIHVADLSKAEEFYAGVLRLEVIDRSKDRVVFESGAFRLWVNRSDKPLSFVPSFDVADFAAARERLAMAGCTQAGLADSYFRDPFGFVFDIIERK